MLASTASKIIRLPKSGPRWLWAGVRPLLPLLAPFSIAVVFFLLYCGPNFTRAWGCLAESRLALASGPRVRSGSGAGGRPSFFAFDLGANIARVVRRNAGNRPAWWSLDFWANPDAYDRIAIENRTSAGTEDGIRRLFKDSVDPTRVDLAILQDGLFVDGALQALNEAEPDRILSLVPLYRSVLCIFVRKDLPIRSLGEAKGRHARAYLGQTGSGTRYLARRVLGRLGVDVLDTCPEWSPEQVAGSMVDATGDRAHFDIAFVLDKIDSGVIRTIVDGGRHDLLTIDAIDDLFRDDVLLKGSASMRPVRLAPSSLSQTANMPGRSVATIETHTILACSADLPDWDAYQVTRLLVEHFRELGLGAEPAIPVSQTEPGGGFDYLPHAGAVRYYQHGARAESFPYQVLVVAIGASLALMAYWQNLVMKWRADRLVRRVDAGVIGPEGWPVSPPERLDAIRLEAIDLFRHGLIGRDGLDRIKESLDLRRMEGG